MFTLFPSESVLFGLALGEYLRLRELGQNDSFEAVLTRRAHPFVPDMTQEIQRRVRDEDVPNGTDWVPLVHLGRDKLEVAINTEGESASLNLIRRDGVIYSIEYDRSRRSSLDLLIDYLTAGQDQHRTEWNDESVVRQRWDIERARPRPEPPPEEISRKMDALVAENSVQQTFALGKVLGRVFGDCVIAEHYLVRMEEAFNEDHNGTCETEQFDSESPGESGMHNELTDSPYDALERSWGNLVENLRMDPIFRFAFQSDDVIVRSSKQVFAGRYFGLSRRVDNFDSVLNASLCIRTNLCLILGKILGVLRADDDEARIRDAQRATPRAFLVPRTARSERIGGALYLAEQAFNEQELLPETIVAGLGNTIEALSRQLWPAWPEEQGVSGLLKEKNHRGDTELEKRFAAIALPLYVMYRNSAEHRPNTFRCSTHEARHFFSGMRSLYDLSKRIENARQAKGK